MRNIESPTYPLLSLFLKKKLLRLVGGLLSQKVGVRFKEKTLQIILFIHV